MSDDIRKKRLWWHSRRGMLELDVILIPFVEQAFDDLSEDDKQRYEDLLAQEDTELFVWFMDRQIPEDADLARIVSMVLEHARTRKL